jgi:CheY-like chemotaxis protein
MMSHMTITPQPLRILCLSAGVGSLAPLHQTLTAFGQVELVTSLDDALARLRHEHFDAVLTGAGDFLPIERVLTNTQSGLLLNNIAEGICLADRHGHILWNNQRVESWPPEVRAELQHVAVQTLEYFRSQQATEGRKAPLLGSNEPDPGGCKTQKITFSVNAKHYEAICNPILDHHRVPKQVIIIAWDATQGRQLQNKIDAIDMAGRELVRLEGEVLAKLDVGQRLKLLEDKIIQYVRHLFNFDHFAIRTLNPQNQKLEVLIAVGLPSAAIELDLYARPEGNGISGYVASTGRSYICPDVTQDPLYVTGLSEARSSLTVPLWLHDKVIGIFNVESQRPMEFSENDRQFAEIFGRYVALAINVLKLLATERYTTTGQVAQDVSGELSGPLNDIVSETSLLMDDYIGNDEMRRRLQSILDNVEKIRTSVREVGNPRALSGSLGLNPTVTDPVLNGKRILVADDEPAIRQTISDVLRRYGCVVQSAIDGADALRIFDAEGPFDLILSDIKMPHKTGYDIFAYVRKKHPKLPVILMTGFGYDPHHSIVRATQQGLSAVLFKPFKVDQLLEQMRKAMTPASPG